MMNVEILQVSKITFHWFQRHHKDVYFSHTLFHSKSYEVLDDKWLELTKSLLFQASNAVE